MDQTDQDSVPLNPSLNLYFPKKGVIISCVIGCEAAAASNVSSWYIISAKVGKMFATFFAFP